MQERQIVAYFLIPTDQHPTETVHPTMCTLHDPTTRFVSRLLLDRLRLLAPRPDMGGEPELGQQVPHLVEVIALVQTHPLGLLSGWLGALDGDTHDGRSGH